MSKKINVVPEFVVMNFHYRRQFLGNVITFSIKIYE